MIHQDRGRSCAWFEARGTDRRGTLVAWLDAMAPVLAWLPFLTALVLAFTAGVVFARLNESGSDRSLSRPKRGGIHRLNRADAVLTTALVGFLLAVVLVWLVAVVSLFRGHVM